METVSAVDSSQMLVGILLLLVGLVLAKLIGKSVERLAVGRLSAHHSLLARRIASYCIGGVFLFTALQQVGVNLSVLLGAAGILTVALGFASQTSASNIISGLFLLGEKPFSVGDTIKIDTLLGEVLSIDLLSVKLRTFDNLFVRIPNETIIKSQVTTITKYPIRRFDLLVGVAYKEDIEKANKLLLQIADEFALCLEDPAPKVFIQGFGESSIDLQLSVWTLRENYFSFKNEMIIRVKKAFDQNGIEIPFPHRTLYSGSDTNPFPLKISDSCSDGTNDTVPVGDCNDTRQ